MSGRIVYLSTRSLDREIGQISSEFYFSFYFDQSKRVLTIENVLSQQTSTYRKLIWK